MSAERFKHLPRKEREGKWRELALVRDEIFLITQDQYPGRSPTFVVPIHPLVVGLPEEVRFDRKYAERVFDLVWDWTTEDVERFINDIERRVGFEEKKDLERLIGEGKEYWRFKHFSSSQNLLLSTQCLESAVLAIRADDTAHLPVGILAPHHVRFSREKINEYSVGEVFEKGEAISFPSSAFLTHKKLDNVVQGYLLRNWCIAYHNQLLKVALGLETPK